MKVINESLSPKVATFWYIEGAFYGDEVSVRDGEIYGNFVQSPEDHINLWSSYSAFIPEFKGKSYTHYPRGRVMLNTKIKKFMVCCDRCLHTDKIKKEIISHFNLPRDGSVIWDTDDHYRCHECGGNNDVC